MAFGALYKKNMLVWKRNLGGCLCEVLTTVVFGLLLFMIVSLTDDTEKEDTSFVDKTIRLGPDGSLGALAFPDDYKAQVSFLRQIPIFRGQMMKNCSFVTDDTAANAGDNGGYVALSPGSSPIVARLKTLFETVFEFEVKTFDSSADFVAEIKKSEYGGVQQNGKKNQICFGADFTETASNQWVYSVHYNVTGPPDNHDVLGLDEEMITQFQVEDGDKFIKQINSGFSFMLNFIDTEILRLDTGNSNAVINAEFASMPYKEYKTGAIFTATNNGDISMYLAFPLLIIYLRFVYSILYEKEHRIAQNLKNMGMSTTTYYLSSLAWYVTVLFGLSLVWLLIVKFSFFPDANIFLVWSLYFVTGLAFIGIGLFITAFFNKAKPGTLAAIVVFFLLFGTNITMGALSGETVARNTWFSLSPVAGVNKAGAIMILVQSNYQPFDFGLFSEEILNFKFSNWFFICIAEFVILTLLGIYFDLVWPKDTGVRKHPLFCFIKKKKQLNQTKYPSSKMSQDKSNFEAVSGELLAQKSRNQTLEITDLRKVYGNGKVAVQSVTMSMYSNQIFALLGHNGAGKTTTISMVSGLIPTTSGQISILGFDSIADPEKVKSVMGVCPQTNPIYPTMTCEEHLYLYAAVKKSKKSKEELAKEIKIILEDIDLYDKRDFIAGKLSGGQKRKLCVACAFIGGSKVILLDEPTSGLDVAARRHLWEMLKKYKKDKIIILTTHFMDEADFLGDRIGVMGDGKVLTCGSSLFLKNKFGVGYGLTLVKSTSEVSTSKLTELIKSKVPSAFLEADISKEIKYVLPTKDLDKFESLFAQLEERAAEYGIESFGVSLTTLEDVFLRIAELLGHHKKTDKGSEKKIENVGLEDEEEVELEQIRLKSSSKIFQMHFKALVKKRFIYFKRDLKSLICEIVIPIIVVFIGIMLTLIQIVNEPVAGNMDATAFDIPTVQFEINAASSIANHINTSHYQVETFSAATIQQFDAHLQTNSVPERMVASYVSLADGGSFTYNYTLFFNTTAGHSLDIGINAMDSAILREATGNSAASITVKFDPLPLTEGGKSFESTADGFLSVFLISLAFAFIPSSMVMFVVQEREHNSKNQQIVSGVSLSAYWSANLLVDFMKYFIVGFMTIIAIIVFDVQAFLEGDGYFMTILLFMLYGPCMIAFTYLTSFLFKSASSAQIASFVFSLFTGFILMLVTLILRLLESTKSLSTNFLEFIFRLTPMFNLCFGLFSLANKFLWKGFFSLDEIPTAWSRYGSIFEILFMCIIFFGSFSLIFMIELKKGKVSKDNEKYEKVGQVQELEGEDVQKEKNEVEKSDDYSIRVRNMAKVYKMINNQGGCCSGKKVIIKKAAVKGIHFGVKKGECFGLLGTNGAGKTTTFKVLSGEIQPTTGSLTINRMDVATQMKKIRTLIGYCPQFDALLGKMTTREHLEMYAAIKGIPKNMWEKLISRKIKQLNLTEYEHVQAGTYSGGNKRKLSVAIALLGNPPIVFLDEPSSGMDPEARRFMWSVVGNISSKQKKSSVVLTTHSMEEAEALSTKLAIMVEGKIKCIGPVQTLKNTYGKGFELEVKLKKPTEEETKKLLNKSGFLNRGKLLNRAQVFEFLDKVKQAGLKETISESGNAAYIHNELKNTGKVETKTVAEYAALISKASSLQKFLSKSFGKISVIENYQTFYRFKIEDDIKISALFGQMEKNKQQLNLDQYSVKQTSIEQIFINFANARAPDESV